MRIFHPGRFGFNTQDVRIEGTVIDGGRSISGLDDPIRTDGGGYVVADYSNGVLIDREANLAWRAMGTAMDGGAASLIVRLCDPRHRPHGSAASVPHSDKTPFADDAEYKGGVTTAEVAEYADLRATSLLISYLSAQPLVGGEWFSILHETWGDRAYNIISVEPEGDKFRIEFRPPLREITFTYTALNFDDPRCRMRGRPGGNPLEGLRTGTAAVSFVEDMRRPENA